MMIKSSSMYTKVEIFGIGVLQETKPVAARAKGQIKLCQKIHRKEEREYCRVY